MTDILTSLVNEEDAAEIKKHEKALEKAKRLEKSRKFEPMRGFELRYGSFSVSDSFSYAEAEAVGSLQETTENHLRKAYALLLEKVMLDVMRNTTLDGGSDSEGYPRWNAPEYRGRANLKAIEWKAFISELADFIATRHFGFDKTEYGKKLKAQVQAKNKYG